MTFEDLISAFRSLTPEQQHELGNRLGRELASGQTASISEPALVALEEMQGRIRREYEGDEPGRPPLVEDMSASCTALSSHIHGLVSERDHAYNWLRAWQDWNRQMHHELRICDIRVHPDDTKGRRVLAARLRSGVVADEAVVRLRAELNQLAYECSLLAKWLVEYTAAAPTLDAAGTTILPGEATMTLAERHYRPAELEPSGDTVPHPYRMTPELAAALSGLMEAEDPDPEHQAHYHPSTLPAAYLDLSESVERVLAALRAQEAEIG